MKDFLTVSYNTDSLLAMAEEKQYRKLKSILDDCNEVDVAEFIEELDAEKTVLIFRMLAKEQAADVFAMLTVEHQQIIIDRINDAELKTIIEALFVDDAVDMLEELPANVVSRVMKNASPATRNLINQFLNYPENSAGSIMTAEYIGLKKTMTVGEAVTYVRKVALDKETIYTCYVTDPMRRLEGVLSLKDLFLHPEETVLSEIMDENVLKAVTTQDKEEVADLFQKYGLLALPVVDTEQRLVGIITFDDAIEVIQDEATEDMEKMAATLPSDRPYLKTGVFALWKNRIPWLLFLMVSSTFTGSIISGFEDALAVFPALLSFIPMLMGTSGNAGGQTSVTIIRGIALNEIAFKDIFCVLWKELRVAVVCGVVLAVANFGKIILLDNMLLRHNVSLMEAAVVCVTLLVAVLCAKLIGCALPLLAKKVGFDPAVMASPFITTIVDAVSLLVFFGIAVSVLPM